MVPAFSPSTSWKDFFQGLWLPFSALGMIFRSPKLFLLSLLASVVTLAALIGIVWGVVHWNVELISWVFPKPEAWWGQALWYVVDVVMGLVLVVALANTIPLLLLAPLQDPISEAAETKCGGYQAHPFSVGQVLVAFGHTLSRLTLLWVGNALLLLFNLIPVAGHVIWMVTSIAWTMGWLAIEYLDSPMTRHRFAFKDVRRVVVQRLPLSLGFGAALYVLLWIPVVNFFLIPLAIVGGTLLYRGLVACGNLRAPTPT